MDDNNKAKFKPAVRYYEGMNEAGYTILHGTQSALNTWLSAIGVIDKINVNHTTKNIALKAQLQAIVSDIEEYTRATIQEIDAEIRAFTKNKRKISRDRADVEYILKACKFVNSIKDRYKDPFFDIDRIVEYKKCTRDEAQYCIDMMEDSGINQHCAYYALIDAIIGYTSHCNVSYHTGYGSGHFEPGNKVDPIYYNDLIK